MKFAPDRPHSERDEAARIANAAEALQDGRRMRSIIGLAVRARQRFEIAHRRAD